VLENCNSYAIIDGVDGSDWCILQVAEYWFHAMFFQFYYGCCFYSGLFSMHSAVTYEAQLLNGLSCIQHIPTIQKTFS